MKFITRHVLAILATCVGLLAHAQAHAQAAEPAPTGSVASFVVFGLAVLAMVAWFVIGMVKNERKRAAERREAE